MKTKGVEFYLDKYFSPLFYFSITPNEDELDIYKDVLWAVINCIEWKLIIIPKIKNKTYKKYKGSKDFMKTYKESFIND